RRQAHAHERRLAGRRRRRHPQVSRLVRHVSKPHDVVSRHRRDAYQAGHWMILMHRLMMVVAFALFATGCGGSDQGSGGHGSAGSSGAGSGGVGTGGSAGGAGSGAGGSAGTGGSGGTADCSAARAQLLGSISTVATGNVTVISDSGG